MASTLGINVELNRAQIKREIRRVSSPAPEIKLQGILSVHRSEVSRISRELRGTPVKLPVSLSVTRTEVNRLRKQIGNVDVRVTGRSTSRGTGGRSPAQNDGVRRLNTSARTAANNVSTLSKNARSASTQLAKIARSQAPAPSGRAPMRAPLIGPFGQGLGGLNLSQFVSTGALLGGAQALGVGAVTGAGAGLAGLVAGLRSAFQAYSDLDFAVTRATAVFAIQGREAERLESTIKQLGATTTFTAREAANAAIFLGQAGLTVQEAISAARPTLDLAVIGDLGLAETADLITNVAATLGKPVSDYRNLVDLITKATTTANTNVEQFAQALKTSGGLAAGAGVELNELAGIVGILSNRGIQGEQAGHGLNVIIRSIYRPTLRAQRVFRQLGVSFRDSTGQMRPFSENLRTLLGVSLNVNQRFALFGTEGVKHFEALQAAGVGALDELVEKYTNVEGASDAFIRKLESTSEFQIRLLQSQADAVAVSLGEIASQGFLPLIQSTREALEGIGNVLNRYLDIQAEVDRRNQADAGPDEDRAQRLQRILSGQRLNQPQTGFFDVAFERAFDRSLEGRIKAYERTLKTFEDRVLNQGFATPAEIRNINQLTETLANLRRQAGQTPGVNTTLPEFNISQEVVDRATKVREETEKQRDALKETNQQQNIEARTLATQIETFADPERGVFGKQLRTLTRRRDQLFRSLTESAGFTPEARGRLFATLKAGFEAQAKAINDALAKFDRQRVIDRILSQLPETEEPKIRDLIGDTNIAVFELPPRSGGEPTPTIAGEEGLDDSVDRFAGISQDFADGVTNFITGTESFRDSVESLLQNVARDFIRSGAQTLAQQAFQNIPVPGAAQRAGDGAQTVIERQSVYNINPSNDVAISTL